MRCLGRTNNKKRCSNPTSFIVCHLHKRQAIKFLTITVPSTFLLYLGIVEYLVPFFTNNNKVINVENEYIKYQNEWAGLVRNGDWKEYRKVMNSYKDDSNYNNLYLLYKGTYVAHNKLRVESPSIIFFKIDPESKFYFDGLRQLNGHYSLYYSENEQITLRNKILTELDKTYPKSTYKFALKYLNSQNNLNELVENFDEFMLVYISIYNFNTHQFEITFEKGKSPPFDFALYREIQAVTYLYLNRIYYLSNKSKKEDLCKNIQLLTNKYKVEILEGLGTLTLILDSEFTPISCDKK